MNTADQTSVWNLAAHMHIHAASLERLGTSYVPRLVALSVLIATLASYAALDMAGRTVASRERARAVWLAAGSMAMGIGIWSMHFVGMLAFRLNADPNVGPSAGPVVIWYDGPLMGVSIVVAVAASALALGVVSRSQLTTRGMAAGALLMGSAIAGMHYVGMAAMRMPATLAYRPGLVAMSLGIAIGASYAALWLARRLGNVTSRAEALAKIGAACIMGVAIAGMHYTAMAAAFFTSGHDAGMGQVRGVVASSELAGAISIGAVVVLVVALLSAALDREHHAELDETLRRSEARFRAVSEAASDAIVSSDASGRIVFWNAAAMRIFGYTDSEALGQLLAVLLPTMRHDVGPADGTVDAEAVRRDGSVFPVELSLSTWRSEGELYQTRIIRDVTRRKALERQLMHEAFHDPLTGLANRLLFRDRVEHALARVERGAARPVVLFLDLDNFKRINDGWGHHVGDAVLVQVATRVSAALRAADTCARLGGDEFAVLLEEPDGAPLVDARAAQVAARIIAALDRPLRYEGKTFTVGVSVGIAAAAVDDGVDELLRNADLAMYRAKARGKGRFEVFEPAMHSAVRRRLDLEAELRRVVAQDCDELVVHYQPIASIASGRIAGFEALVRWASPEGRLVPPGEFIPVAEETGLIIPIGRHVLRSACRQVRAWQTRLGGDPLTVTVNLSGRQLLERDLPSDVAAALSDSGLDPVCLVLEITESVLIDDSEATLGRLRALKALGIRLAIDDFGTGFSSLRYLERFPVDLLKIDRSFVQRVGLDHGESPLARAILGLGGALGMRVVAEGIETQAQWSRLGELGCELGQGYFFARPQPATLVEQLLVEHARRG